MPTFKNACTGILERRLFQNDQSPTDPLGRKIDPPRISIDGVQASISGHGLHSANRARSRARYRALSNAGGKRIAGRPDVKEGSDGQLCYGPEFRDR